MITLDSDLLVLHDLRHLNASFQDFTPNQVAGFAGEQAEYYKKGWYMQALRGERQGEKNKDLKKLPFYPPYGLNTGVGLLWIERLRQANFSTKVASLVEYYGAPNFALGDQDIWNTYLALEPEEAFLLPCEWNVRTDSLCPRREDPGTKILHGSRFTLHSKSRPEAKAWRLLRDTIELVPSPAPSGTDDSALTPEERRELALQALRAELRRLTRIPKKDHDDWKVSLPWP